MINTFLAFLDLFGVALIGITSAILIRGLQGLAAGDQVTSFLQLLNLDGLPQRSLLILLGGTAIFFFILKTILSVYFLRRTLRYMSIRNAQISSSLVSKMLNRPVEKNLRLAIEVLEIVQKKVANCHFLIIEEIMSQEELSLLFSAADLLLFTSTSEGSPNLVRESIACGCPVVSVRVGDVEKWINLSGSGRVCDYDPKNIVDAVVDSLTLPKSVLPHTADYFSTSESSKNLLKAYSKIVNGIKPLKS
jgi:hypothetical protein